MNTIRAYLTFWGTRGTCPSPGLHTNRYGGNTSCVEVQLADGSRVILDAGTGLRALGRAMMSREISHDKSEEIFQAATATSRAATPTLRAARTPPVTVVLTHRHLDHVNGLAHFAPLLQRSHRLHLACNEVSASELRALVVQQLSVPLFPTIGGVVDAVEIVSFDTTDTLRISPTLRVRALMAHHPGGASILLVEDNHGPLVAYAPDNELAMTTDDPALLEWRSALQHTLQGIPVLVHDSTYTRHEIAKHQGWGHSSADEAVDFAASCSAGTIYLTHHHPDRSDAEIDHMIAGCTQRARAAGHRMVVHAAAEGITIPIS